MKESFAEMGEGDHPARTGLIGRNTIQGALLKLSQAAILGITGAVAGRIATHTHADQWAIVNGAAFSDKAIAFLLNNDADLRALAAVAPDRFGFVSQVIDWLKMKLDI